MTIAAALLANVIATDARIALPAVTRLHVPARRDDPGMESEFGLVELEDGSAGLFFAMLGDTLDRLHTAVHDSGAAGRSPAALAAAIESDDEVERAVALGAICAVTQHVFRRAGFAPGEAANSLGGGEFSASDHVGMVGLFPSLVRRLRERGIPLTVLELKPEKVERAANFEVTLDPARLRACNTVMCTASTLINGSLDRVLEHCAHAAHIALIGPSASCFPDALFARGIDVIGGATVVDAQRLATRLARAEKWGATVQRYTLAANDYPGLDALLTNAQMLRSSRL